MILCFGNDVGEKIAHVIVPLASAKKPARRLQKCEPQVVDSEATTPSPGCGEQLESKVGLRALQRQRQQIVATAAVCRRVVTASSGFCGRMLDIAEAYTRTCIT